VIEIATAIETATATDKKIPSNFMEFIKFKGTAKHEKI